MKNITQAIDNLPSLKLTVESKGLMAKRSLGQNFLLDRNITDKIIRTSMEIQGLENYEGANLFEIGPGPGGLTRSVLRKNPKKMTVIEMDERCIKIMEEIKEVTGDVLEIIEGDALKEDIHDKDESPRHIVSNLPYNISVPLLIKWLKKADNFESMTLMFQKEVADRISAEPGCKAYGRISILAQIICNIDRVMDLNPEAFVPAPKIWSSVLLFQPKKINLDPVIFANLEKITAATFGMRRKMIRQSLKSIGNVQELCEKANIEPTLRAEQLTIEDYLNLAHLI